MNSLCDGCPLQNKVVPQKTKGELGARFLVVTDVPMHDKLIDNNALRFFAKCMKKQGFGQHDFAFTPHIRCHHDPDLFSSEDKKSIANHCRQYLVNTIDRFRPEVVIPLGAEAAKAVKGRAVKITKSRGQLEFNDEHDTNVMPFLSPLNAVLYPQNAPIFEADCAGLGRLYDHNYDLEEASRAIPKGNYEYVNDLQFLVDQDPKEIAFDIETTGLRWYEDGEILTMQFCCDGINSYVLGWDHPDQKKSQRAKFKLRKQIIQLLCKPGRKVHGQNSKFDSLWMAQVLGIKFRFSGDTLMLATLIDENAYTKGLDILVKRYLPHYGGYSEIFDRTVDKGNLKEVPLDDKFLQYAAGDSFVVYHLHHALYREIRKTPSLRDYYHNVSIPALNMFCAVEGRGVLVNDEALVEFEKEMVISTTKRYYELLEQVPKSIKQKHIKGKVDEYGLDLGLKFTRAAFVIDILFEHEDGFKLRPQVFTDSTAKLEDKFKKPSVSTKDHLPYFFNDCTFTLELAEYIKEERLLGTDVRSFKEKYIRDGLVRCSYGLTTAVTGRSNSSSPNLQNRPKRGKAAEAYRAIYVAPEEYYILSCDLSQIELRIAANYANEKTMLEVYRRGEDIHIKTACATMGIDVAQFDLLSEGEQELARFKAKAINFGFIFTMGWRKFIVYAKTQYGIEFTEREAQKVRSDFFNLYPGLSRWHSQVREHAREHKQITSFSGRIRHLPMIDSTEEWIQHEAERQSINSPVQEMASTLGLLAMSRLHEDIDDQYLSPRMFIHDDVKCYVRKENLLWGAQTVKRYMENVPIYELFGVRMKCPIIADASFSNNMGKELKLKNLDVNSSAYDFSKYWNEETKTGILVPPQVVPAYNGKRIKSYYTPIDK